MARSINELPVDAVVDGAEKLVVQNTNNQPAAVTVSTLGNYISNQLALRPVVTTNANTFARTYPVVGSIAKGQGCVLFRDADNAVKMRSSDNSSLNLTVGAELEFAQNVDDFSVDLRTLTETMKIDPKTRTLEVSFSQEVTRQSDGSYTSGVISQEGVFNNIRPTITKVDISSTGAVSFVITGASGFRIWSRQAFQLVNGLYNSYYFSGTDLNYGSSERTVTMGNIAGLTANTVTLGFNLHHDDSYTRSQLYVFPSQSVTTNSFNIKTSREDENGYFSGSFVVDGTNPNIFNFDFGDPLSVHTLKFNSIASNTFASATLTQSTRIMSFTFSSKGYTGTAVGISTSTTNNTSDMNIVIGGNIVASIRITGTGLTHNITLTAEQLALIQANLTDIKFNFVLTDTRYPENIRKMYEYGAVDADDELPELDLLLSYYYNTSNILTLYTYGRQSTTLQVDKISDTKLILKTGIYANSRPLCFRSVLKPVFNDSGDNTLSALENRFTRYRFSESTFSSLYIVLEKENDVWIKKNTFSPMLTKLSKSDDEVDNTLVYGDSWLKVKENDTHIYYYFNSFNYSSSYDKSLNVNNLLGEAQLSSGRLTDDSHATAIVKLNKTTNVFEYVLNDSTDFVSNYFPVINDVIGFYSQIGSEQDNIFKLFYLKQTLIRIYNVTKGVYNTDFEKWTIAQAFTDTISNTSLSRSVSNFYQSQWIPKENILVLLTDSNYNIIRFNSTLDNVLRNYNSATRLYDSATINFTSVGISRTVEKATDNLLQLLIGTSAFATSLRSVSFSSNRFFGVPYHVSHTVNRTFSITGNISGARKEYFNFTDNVTKTLKLNGSPHNTAMFFNGSRVWLRTIDPSVHDNTYAYNFSVRNAIGIALDDYADGVTGTLGFLSGSSVIELSDVNLIEGANYYLNRTTGLLNIEEGRLIGRAISSTQILTD